MASGRFIWGVNRILLRVLSRVHILHELLELRAKTVKLANDLGDCELRRFHCRVLGRDVIAGFLEVGTELVELGRVRRNSVAELIDAAMILDQLLVGLADENCVPSLVTLQGLDSLIE